MAADSNIADLTSDPERLDSLTGLRFFAAMWVLMLHIIILLGARLPGGYLWSYGSLGVTFFFALSGFVLTWTARAGDPARRFWRKRVARVVPLYLAMLVISELALVLLPLPAGRFAATGSDTDRWVIPLLSLLMLQAWIAPGTLSFQSVSASSPNPPGWSLSAEAFFYALFPAVVPLCRRLSRRGIALALGADLVLMLIFYGVARAAGHGQPMWLGNFPAFQLGFFVAGMLTARAVREDVRFPPLGAAVGAMAGLCVVFYVGAAHHVGESTDLPLVELVAAPFMLVLLGAAANADRQGKRSPFRNRWLVTLGVWSYALYLVQIACFVVASCILRHGLSSDRSLASLEAIVFIAGAIAVAGVAHRFIELPANARLRHAPPAIIEQEEQRPESTGALL